MKKILTLLVLSITLATAILGQQPYWGLTKGPFGGSFSLVRTPGDTLYALHIKNWKTTYRSTDGGLSWKPLTFLQTFEPNELDKQVKVSEAGTVYVKIVSTNTWYKTRNDGQSWESTYPFDLELADGIRINISSSLITRSTNGGASGLIVQYLPTGSSPTTTLTHTLYGGILVEDRRAISSVFRCHLYRSQDEGATWTTQEVDRRFYNFFFTPAGTLLCSRNDTLFRSVDGGASFMPTPLTGVISNSTSPSYQVLSSGRILFLKNESSLQYSDDDGLTWNTLSTGDQGCSGLFQPIFPLSDGTIFKTDRWALLRSNDGGVTWQFSGTGMRANPVWDMHFVSESVYFAYTHIGLWKTTDAGENWTLLNFNLTSPNYLTNFGVTTSNKIALVQDKRLLWSEDGGAHFTDITPTSGFDLLPALFLNPENGHLFVRTNQGLERTTDGGQTWTLSYPSQYALASMAFHPSGRIFSFLDYQLRYSDDGGITWVAHFVQDAPSFRKIIISLQGDVYLVQSNNNEGTASLWKSEDIGETWVKLPKVFDYYIPYLPQIAIADNGFLYTAFDNSTISLSVNKGQTWQTLPHPVDSVNNWGGWGTLTTLAVSPDQKLVAGTQQFGLYKSQNPLFQGSFITGSVRRDADADCSTADAQEPVPNRNITAQTGSYASYTTTDTDGQYIFLVSPGNYSLTVQNPNNVWWENCDSPQTVDILADNTVDTLNFSSVAVAECPLVSVNVAAPTMRRCFDNDIYVQYCNIGTETADSAYVDVFLDPYLSFVSSSQSHTEMGSNTIRFFVGDLLSGDCGQFKLTAYLDCSTTVLGQTHCISAHGYPDTLCTQIPSWSGANLEASVECQDSLVQFKLKNTGPAGSVPLDYIIIEDDVVMYQGTHQYAPAEELTLPVQADGHTYRIESEQEPGHPFSYRVLAFEEGCGGFQSLGFINQFSVNGVTPSWHRVCVENTGSYDPNDKQGFPLGAGDDHRIRPGQPLEYMIRFQNTGTDTAFTVVVRDTLSAWLDPASVVPGAASHPYTWQLSGQGAISFTFPNILLPDSTTNLPGSQGFVTFQIAQKTDVPLGTKIRNQAAIFFDFNEPVMTNTTLHTVGLEALSGTLETPFSAQNHAVEVSPNPATEQATFRLSEGSFKAHNLEVYSPLGALVLKTTVTGNAFVLPRRNLPAGAYGWRVTDAHGALTGSGVVMMR